MAQGAHQPSGTASQASSIMQTKRSILQVSSSGTDTLMVDVQREPRADIASSSVIGLSAHLITFHGSVALKVTGLLTAAANKSKFLYLNEAASLFSSCLPVFSLIFILIFVTLEFPSLENR